MLSAPKEAVGVDSPPKGEVVCSEGGAGCEPRNVLFA